MDGNSNNDNNNDENDNNPSSNKRPRLLNIHDAIAQHDLVRVQKLVEENPLCLLEHDDMTGNTPLMDAIMNACCEDIIKFIIQENPDCILGPNNNSDNEEYYTFTPLLVAIQYNRLEICQLLLQTNINCINVQATNNGKVITPLLYAIQEKREAIALYILQVHPSSVTTEKNPTIKSTPLLLAIQKNLTKAAQMIIQINPDLLINDYFDGKEHREYTPPLIVAMQRHQLELSKYIINNYPTCLDRQSNKSQTPFFAACALGFLEIVKIIINDFGGKYLKTCDHQGCTPLMAASHNGHLAIVKVLINTDPTCIRDKNEDGSTAIMIATYRDELEIVKFILEACPDCLNDQDVDGSTPLMIACEQGFFNFAKVIIDTDPNNNDCLMVQYLIQTDPTCINIKCKNGCIPLMIACNKGQIKIVKYLIQTYPDSLEYQNYGFQSIGIVTSPLIMACLKGYAEIMWLILKTNPLVCCCRYEDGEQKKKKLK